MVKRDDLNLTALARTVTDLGRPELVWAVGWRFVRWTWPDLYPGEVMVRRLARFLL